MSLCHLWADLSWCMSPPVASAETSPLPERVALDRKLTAGAHQGSVTSAPVTRWSPSELQRTLTAPSSPCTVTVRGQHTHGVCRPSTMPRLGDSEGRSKPGDRVCHCRLPGGRGLREGVQADSQELAGP